MPTIRERLTILAAPLGIELPEEYIAFMETPPKRGIMIRHLCNTSDPAYEWLPESIDGLEEDIHGGLWKKIELFAHLMRATAEGYIEGGHDHLTGSRGETFETRRLSRGFWIGEVDGDLVFIDHLTLGIFAYLAHEDEVEQWALSFGDFVKYGQQFGRCVIPETDPDEETRREKK
jgi:hypothetical protein